MSPERGAVAACYVGNQPSKPLPPEPERSAGQDWELGDPELRYGQLVGEVALGYWLVIDCDGRVFICAETAMYGPDEKVASFAGSPLAWLSVDPIAIKERTDMVLSAPSVQQIVRRIARTIQRIDPAERREYDAWSIPMVLPVGKSSEPSPLLLSYIDAEPRRRGRFEAAVESLTRKQRLLYCACVLGTTPQSWIADAWGISRQAVNEVLSKAKAKVELLSGFSYD